MFNSLSRTFSAFRSSSFKPDTFGNNVITVSYAFSACTWSGDLFVGLVGEICGSPIRSNGRRKLGSRSPRTRCGIARFQLFPVGSQFAFRTSLPSPVDATASVSICPTSWPNFGVVVLRAERGRLRTLQLASGFWARSTMTVRTGTLPGASFKPSCSCSAVNMEVRSLMGSLSPAEASGVQASSKSNRPVRPV